NLIDLDGTVETYTTPLNTGNFNPDPLTLMSDFVFLNTVANNELSFHYDFDGAIYSFLDLGGIEVCEDCEYTVEITITNPDGVETTYTEEISHTTYDGSCSPDTYATEFPIDGDGVLDFDYTAVELGEYKITKKLIVNSTSMIEDMMDDIIDTDVLDDLIIQHLADLDLSGCFTECDDFCEYWAEYEYTHSEPAPTTAWADLTPEAKQLLIDACLGNYCNTDEVFEGDDEDDAEGYIGLFEDGGAHCTGYLLQLYDQISPGGYAYEGDGSVTFWDAVNDGVGGTITTLDLYLEYDETGTGIGSPISSLATLQDADNFMEEWLPTLVEYHREYCHYDLCDQETGSLEFDANLGLLIADEAGINSEWPTLPAEKDAIFEILFDDPDYDPFVDSDFDPGTELETFIDDYDYPCTAGSGDIFDYIDEISACLVLEGEDALTETEKWLLFRGLYSSAKQQIIDDYKAAISPDACGYFNDDWAIYKSGVTFDPESDDAASDFTNFMLDNLEDIIEPDCDAVCDYNVDNWMGSLSASCIEALEAEPSATLDPLLTELDDIEVAFGDYCSAWCSPANPGGWFFNHDASETYPGGTDTYYNDVMDILVATCPDFEVSFETIAPETEVLDHIVEQTFDDCFITMLTYLDANVWVDNGPTWSPSSTNLPLTFDDSEALYNDCLECSSGSDTERQWTISSGGNSITETCQSSGEVLCNSFIEFTDLDGTTIPLSLIKDIDLGELLKEITETVEEIVTVDITYWNGTAEVTERGIIDIRSCYDPGPFNPIEIFVGAPDIEVTYPDWKADCIALLTEIAEHNAYMEYMEMIDETVGEALNELGECLEGLNEEFLMEYDILEYNYTLFYYDQAGNLVQTVPPVGVDILTAADFPAASGYTAISEPNHTEKTIYTYNGANVMTESETPDMGLTKMYYDDLFRSRFTQNEKQDTDNKFTYVKYDELGRPYESGEAGSSLAADYDLQANVNNEAFPSELIRWDYITTTYGENFGGALDEVMNGGQQNLLGRVSSVRRVNVDNDYVTEISASEVSAEFSFGTETFFSYDAHGNIKEVAQKNNELGVFTNWDDVDPSYEHNYKTFRYEYDLFSGNVEEVVYEEGELDEWRHRYHYDAANRLIRAWTSDDGIEWEMDAKYFYYIHGALSRVEKGHDKVQGMDFAYNLQGWLKGVNSTTLDVSKDIGQDAHTSGLDKFSGADALGFELNYYEDDYVNIGASSPFANSDYIRNQNVDGTTYPGKDFGDLYNGNISHIVLAMKDNAENILPVHANMYKYDLLQRLKQMDVYQVSGAANYTNYNSTNAFSVTNSANGGEYATEYGYDANGNLQSLKRNDHNGTLMDNFTYNYYSGYTNRLEYVSDAISGSAVAEDIESGQATANYVYDAIGQLTADVQENIDEIQWTFDGKVKKVKSTGHDDIFFTYDPSGNRTIKAVGNLEDPGTAGITFDYYVYDNAGNVMSVYERSLVGDDDFEVGTTSYDDKFTLKERHIYGANRLGTKKEDRVLSQHTFLVTNASNFTYNYGYYTTHGTNQPQ
ncbi:MAG: hypothetical protein MI810_03450, partial [Flavobacteriales bacterium]|nr:hypothetical protein [Flavobacteriales bacterium]